MPKIAIASKKDWEKARKKGEYQDGEKLKVIKKYAQQELDAITERPHNEGRIRFLKFVLESERFAGLPIESFPGAIKSIRDLPFMEDYSLPSIYDDGEYWKRILSEIFPLRYPGDQIQAIRVIKKALQELLQKKKEAQQKGGKVPKKNYVILEAATQFIVERPKRADGSGDTIKEDFRKKHKSTNPIDITYFSVKYEVYSDGGKITSLCPGNSKDKYHDKSISYSTFSKTYISEAKVKAKKILSSNTPLKQSLRYDKKVSR